MAKKRKKRPSVSYGYVKMMERYADRMVRTAKTKEAKDGSDNHNGKSNQGA